MKAIIANIKDNWCVIIPPDCLFSLDDFNQNPEKFVMPIYNLEIIKNKEQFLKIDNEVEGCIIRDNKNRKNYFVLKGVQYMEPMTEQNSRTLTLIKGIMGNYSQVALTLDQYNYIQDVAR